MARAPAYRGVVAEYEDVVEARLGFRLREYQRRIGGRLVDLLRRGSRFIVVMMPTGSGKTVIEGLAAFYLRRRGFRVLVVEPTRLLVDQMYRRFWGIIMQGDAVFDYEGRCEGLKGAKIAVMTPRTALKCAESGLMGGFKAVIVDEVHRAYTNRVYARLAEVLKPAVVVGFTALVTSSKRVRLDPALERLLGRPEELFYDFRGLERLGGYKAPKAILDIYDSEMDSPVYDAYARLYAGLERGVSERLQAFLASTLSRHGLEAYCESLRLARGRGRLDSAAYARLSGICREADHKVEAAARAVEDYLDPSIRPAMVFTDRRAAARRLAARLSRGGLKVEMLTGEMPRDERLRLVERARSGGVDVIVSTIVGEEGLDLPEAGLLVLATTPRSPLRFYQRLGRLLRPRPDGAPKYLAVVRTPGTVDYDDLPEAVARLSAEGVDVSYVIPGLEGKTSDRAVVEMLRKLGGSEHFISIASGGWTPEGRVDRGLLGRVERMRLYRVIWEASSKGRIALVPDPLLLADIMAGRLKPGSRGLRLEDGFRITKPLYTLASIMAEASVGKLSSLRRRVRRVVRSVIASLPPDLKPWLFCTAKVSAASRGGGLSAPVRVEGFLGSDDKTLKISIGGIRIYPPACKPSARDVWTYTTALSSDGIVEDALVSSARSLSDSGCPREVEYAIVVSLESICIAALIASAEYAQSLWGPL